MLAPEAIDWIDTCEWIEEIEEGMMGDRYLEDTFRLKDGAPKEIEERWLRTCEMFRIAG